MSAPTWIPCRVSLGSLKPWAANPRLSTKAQAKRILASFAKFGQVLPVAIGPDNEVYDGHQRLSALLTVHGPEYEIDARRSSRQLTDDERRALVVTLHAGAVGAWNWDDLAGWDAAQLGEWGFDFDYLHSLNNDALNVREMLQADEPADPNEEWEGMPEFDNSPLAYKSIHVHFANQDDVDKFAEATGQSITDKTRSIWFPQQKIDHHASGNIYVGKS